jgi:DNA-binding response OmpR family regulator
MDTTIKKPRVLFIEDNPDTREIYKDVLEREGFQVLLAEDGQKGLSYAQATIPDLIILDIMLPKMNGLEVLKKLNGSPETASIPVLIFSAAADALDRQKAMELGAREYTIKATNTPKQVVGKIRALLSRGNPANLQKPAQPMFQIAMQQGRDALKLLKETGLPESFQCPQCHSPIVMGLIPDPTRMQGHWFAAHLLCSNCETAF